MIYKRAVELMEADIGNELVGLEPMGGSCFGFNEVATEVWRKLAEPKSFDELRDALVADFDVAPEQCAIELRELLNDLVERGLIAPDANHGRAGA